MAAFKLVLRWRGSSRIKISAREVSLGQIARKVGVLLQLVTNVNEFLKFIGVILQACLLRPKLRGSVTVGVFYLSEGCCHGGDFRITLL